MSTMSGSNRKKKKKKKKEEKNKNKCLGIEFGFWRERVRGNETQGNVGERCGRKKKKEKNCFTFSISLGWEKVDPSIFSDFLAKLFAGILSFCVLMVLVVGVL